MKIGNKVLPFGARGSGNDIWPAVIYLRVCILVRHEYILT